MSVMNVAGRTRSDRSPEGGGAGFRHEAMLYAGEEQFADRTARFVRAGLGAGESVLVTVTAARADLLRRELGPDAERVDFLDMAEVGRNPARLVPAWRDWIESRTDPAPGLRVVAEAVWSGRTEAEIAECEQHELLLGPAFGQGRGWRLICPYDTESLPVELIARVSRTHALTSEGDEPRTSPDFPHPEVTVEAFLAAALPEPDGAPFQLAFGRDQLPGVRGGVAEQAGSA